MIDERTAGVAGIVATVLFCVALFAFGAIRADYSHFTNAISELGVLRSSNGLAWNLIGFVIPGLLLATCGAGLANAIDGRRRLLWWLLVASGVAFAGTGLIPGEMRNGSPFMESPFTLGHVLMSMLSGMLWLPAVFLLLFRAKRSPGWKEIFPVAVTLAIIAVVGFSANMFSQVLPYLEYRPGIAQRLSFASYFVWYFVISCYLIFASRQSDNRRPEKM